MKNIINYIEELGVRTIEKFNELINDFKVNWFNEDTKKFFNEECDCKDFFK